MTILQGVFCEIQIHTWDLDSERIPPTCVLGASLTTFVFEGHSKKNSAQISSYHTLHLKQAGPRSRLVETETSKLLFLQFLLQSNDTWEPLNRSQHNISTPAMQFWGHKTFGRYMSTVAMMQTNMAELVFFMQLVDRKISVLRYWLLETGRAKMHLSRHPVGVISLSIILDFS